jgi:hypothetical protein
MTDVLHREADDPLMGGDQSPETTAARGGGHVGEGMLHRIVVVEVAQEGSNWSPALAAAGGHPSLW